MAMTAILPTYIPKPPPPTTANYSINSASANLLMDASGEKTGQVFPIFRAGSIRKVHILLGTVTTPTDTDIRIETVSAADGNPTGTLWATNTNASLASGSITSGALVTVTLTADATVAAGDLIAIVVTPSGTPNYNLASASNWDSNVTNAFPYPVQFTTAWSKHTVKYCIFYEYSDGVYGYRPDSCPFTSFTTHSTGSGSTPDEVAMKFTPTVDMVVTGAWFLAGITGNFDIILYDSDGSTALGSRSMDADQDRAATSVNHAPFTSAVTLAAGTTYYLALKPTSASVVAFLSGNVGAAAQLDADGYPGQAWHYAERTDGGVWSATTTRRLLVGLYVTQVDDGTGSGGSGGGSLHHGLLPPHFHPHGGRR